MAHIEKRGERKYRARYRLADGSERSRTFRTRREAEAFLGTVTAAQVRGEYTDPRLGRAIFGAWAEHVEATRVNRRDTTRARDASLMRTRVLPEFGKCKLAGISDVQVKRWVANLETAGLAPSTIRKCYQLLSGVLTEAEASGLIVRSPCQRIKLPTERRREPILLGVDEVDRLVAALPQRYRALVLTGAYTGLRWGEMAGLRLARVDFLRRRIDVAEILIEVDGGVRFGPPKTSRSRALVTFPPFLADVLAAHVSRFPDPDQERALVFTGPQGAALRRSNFRRRFWQPAIDAADLPPTTTFHALRHACASWLIAEGANQLEVAEKLRHAKPATTLTVYGHLFPGIEERLDGLLEEAHDRSRAATPAGVEQLAAYARPKSS